MGNDTAEDSDGYDRSSAVSGVKETWDSGFMSGLAHHVSQSTILLDKTEQKYDEISTNLEHFPHSALDIISDIGCNYTNVVEYPRFLVCEAFWTDEYFSAFWWHQISWKSWGVLAKWHSIDLRRLWISGLFLFLMLCMLCVCFFFFFNFATNLKLAWQAEHRTFVPTCFNVLHNTPKTMSAILGILIDVIKVKIF